MRILIDLQSCQTPGSRNRGIGRYSMSLARAMVQNAPEHEFYLLLNSLYPEATAAIASAFEGLVSPERIVVFSPPAGAQELASESTWRTQAGELIREAVISKIKPDVIHVTSLFEGLTDDCVVSVPKESSETTVAVTLYDLIPLLYPSNYLSDERVRRYYMRKMESLARADLLLGISASSTEEAIEKVPGMSADKVVNISSAVDEHFGSLVQATDDGVGEARAFGISKPFVMYTGGIDWRKNVEGLITAYSLLPTAVKASHQLVLVCHMDSKARHALRALCESVKLTPSDVIFTGFVTDEALVHLYKTCSLFVFPSLHEGFGLPVLEAMKCGAVVIGSNSSSIPEVVGNPEALFDPASVADISRHIERGLTDEQFRSALKSHAEIQATCFSWKETARRALVAIEEAHHNKKKPAARPLAARAGRPAMAMFTPLPPARSGIADYSAELLEVLTQHYDITVISNDPPASSGAGKFAVRNVDWFRENARDFDRIVYQFGNSDFHAHMFALLREFPGVVVLHDFFLSGVLDWMESTGYQTDAFQNALARSHGKDGLNFEQRNGRWKAIAAYPCNRWVVERAQGVIVHSAYSRTLTDSFYGTGFSRAWRTIPLLKSLSQRRTRDEARARLGISPETILVCSFGHLAEGKLNHRLLRAWSRSSLASDPSCRLIFVGQNDPGPYGKSISKQIENGRLGGRVTVTGFTDADLFETYLAATDLAVQLRTNSRGETSKAVLDCMAHGAPVILNANGSMAEYDDRTVLKLPELFEDEELIAALERLRTAPSERNRLAEAGLTLVKEKHHPHGVALQYKEAIESFAGVPRAESYWDLIREIAKLKVDATSRDLATAAVAIAANRALI